MEQDRETLATIFDKYGSPDAKYIERLPKGGTTLDFVGHARITQWLLEVDPLWSIEPVAFDEAGLPARTKHGNMVQAGFWMTVCGHRRYCVGSVEERKQDIGKELISDGIRNGAMRMGFALNLWSKLPLGEEPEPSPAPKKKAAAKKAAPEPEPVADDELADPTVVENFINACKGAKLDATEVCRHAGVPVDAVMDLDAPTATFADLDRLRSSFKELISQ